jgi:hypothetical protein
MSFIGEDGRPAPKLKDAHLSDAEVELVRPTFEDRGLYFPDWGVNVMITILNDIRLFSAKNVIDFLQCQCYPHYFFASMDVFGVAIFCIFSVNISAKL